MKFSLHVAGLVSLLLGMPATATPLKLSPDITLLAVDGKRMTGSLLKGAESLELDSGQHQLLFKVAKSLRTRTHGQVPYSSPPLLVVFNCQGVSSVAIELPRIENERDGRHFERALNYNIVDEKGKALTIKHDVLAIDGPPLEANMEKIIAEYNAQNHDASLFALSHIRVSSLAANTLNQPPQKAKEEVSEQSLQYWFLLADKETQQRFLSWASRQAKR